MADERSTRQLLSEIAIDLRYTRDKTDELCTRLGDVEVELMGQMGNREKPSIRDSLKELMDAHARTKARARWVATLAGAGLAAGLGAWIKSWFTHGP